MGRILPVLFIIVIVIVVIFALNYQKNLQDKQSLSPSQTQNQSNANKDLLINSADVERIKQDYNNRLRESGFVPKKEIEYDFHYKLSPKFINKQSSLKDTLTKVLGVNTCEISSAPDKVSVYELKNKINEVDATAIAREFGITGKPTSLPERDGTFQYFFSNQETDGNLTLFASSGTYVYHKVLKPVSGSISKPAAENIAMEEIKKHKLESSLKLTNSLEQGDYVFHYIKGWDSFPLVDLDSIIALGISRSSVCNIQPAALMNFVEVHIKKDGQLARFINKTRAFAKKTEVSRIGIEKAVSDFKSSSDLPVKPVVIPEDASVKSGEVEITDAVLVWFDYGNAFPQKLYVPFYLTLGKAPNNSALIYTLFPAVSAEELVKAGINTPAGKSKQTLQIDVYVPPPPGGIGYSCPEGEKVCCPGGLVDYTVNCTQQGRTICSIFIAVNAKKDANNVCKEGTFSESGTIDPQTGSNLCLNFAKKHNIEDPQLQYPVSPPTDFTNDPVSCQITGSPC